MMSTEDMPMPPSTVAMALNAARQGDLVEAARLADTASFTELSPGQLLQLTHLRGGIAFELGQLDEAEICFEQVIRLATERRDINLVAKASNNLGSIAHLRGKAHLATSFYLSALSAYTSSDDAIGQAQTGHNLSIVLREFGDFRNAAVHSQWALNAALRTGDVGLQSVVLGGAAEVALAQGDLDAARRFLRDATRLADLAGDRIGVLEMRRLQARVDMQRGRFTAALRDAGRVYLASQRVGALQLAGESALLAANAARELHRTRLADSYRRRAQEAYHRLGSPSRAELAGRAL
jgi:tetratricopeptide (TPR) repeat protein